MDARKRHIPLVSYVKKLHLSFALQRAEHSFNEAVTCTNNKWTSGGWSSGNPDYNHRVSVSLVGGAAASYLNTNEAEAVSTGTLDCANIGFGGAATSDSYTNSVIANDVLQSTAVLKVVDAGNSPNIARKIDPTYSCSLLQHICCAKYRCGGKSTLNRLAIIYCSAHSYICIEI